MLAHFKSGHNKRLLWFYTQKVKRVPILVRAGRRNGPASISNIQRGHTQKNQYVLPQV